MITINCGALPDTLLESELFGYKAGAFTDAKKDKPGRLALAKGGTVFLDEIGDISPALQVRLLRVLQDKTYEPLGGIQSEKADVRIIAATHKDLEQMVAKGQFRQDLYYRINVVKLALPPLRKRKEDIPLLAEHFMRKLNQLRGKDIQGLSPEIYPILMSHNFPGNIRELENILEYASVVCKDTMVRVEHLPDYLHPDSGGRRVPAPDESELTDFSWENMERHFIYEVLKKNNWNRTVTAEQMGIHPTTLWRKMRRLGVELRK
jgi:transcriptional regulator with PAS, ATPase and Fis domain